MKNISFILLVFLPIWIKSQGPVFSGGYGYFKSGYTNIDHITINRYLNSNGIPSISKNGYVIGGGGMGVINNFIIGGEGGAFAANSSAGALGMAEFSAGYGMFNFGYMLPLKSRFSVYPLFGMGWGGSGLKLKYSSGSEMEFGSSASFIKGEINADWFMHGNAEKYEKAGLLTGISVGYMLQPVSEPWKNKNGAYVDVPAMFMNGFYVKLKIGGGGIGLTGKAGKKEN